MHESQVDPSPAVHSGDGGPAASAQLDAPMGVAVDGSGNLYIVYVLSNRVRKVVFGGPATTGPDTADDSKGLAPADELTFNSRMLGTRIISQVLSVDFVSSGRFILSGRFAGSYSYSSTGSDTGTVTLILDAGEVGPVSGLSLNLQSTFTSTTRGSLALSGSTFEWILSGISESGRPPAPLFPDRSGARLDFFIFDVFERNETMAYDLQVREKTSPPAAWRTGCVYGVDPPTPQDVNFRSFSLFVSNVSRGTYQVRYRHRNSPRCGSGTPREWSEIGEEGVTTWPW